uniref:RING-type domain-containing protein n=1 Tax=Anopheles christyi TaxID=43041 RepID=A0A182KAX0_9DIPT
MNVACPICHDAFVCSTHAVTTTCGHMFHHNCILQWLERSSTCPQCRNRCNQSELVKMYFHMSSNYEASNAEDNVGSLEEKLDELTLKIRQQEEILKTIEARTVQVTVGQKRMDEGPVEVEDEVPRTQNTLKRDLENRIEECTAGLGERLTNIQRDTSATFSTAMGVLEGTHFSA